MAMDPTLTALVEYTDWDRAKWQDWLGRQDAKVLDLAAGPHGDGRFERVGDLIKHIFGAEQRYVERLLDRPLTDTAALPHDDLAALFRFGQQSRQELRQLLATFPAEAWDVPREFKILTHSVTASPKKIVIHVLMHEIRHWAQIATLLRVNGLKVEFHDFLFSPATGAASAR